MPKYNPKITREGIKYVWALTKFFYCYSPIVEKKTKDKFRNLARVATNLFATLNIDSICGCSIEARTYIQMYKEIQTINLEDEMTSIKYIMQKDTVKLCRKLKKSCKACCNIADLNKKDVSQLSQLDGRMEQVVDAKRDCCLFVETDGVDGVHLVNLCNK